MEHNPIVKYSNQIKQIAQIYKTDPDNIKYDITNIEGTYGELEKTLKIYINSYMVAVIIKYM